MMPLLPTLSPHQRKGTIVDYVQDYVRRRGIEAELQGHLAWMTTTEGFPYRVRCQCGWEYAISFMELIAAGQASLVRPLLTHLQEEIDKLHPTLSDLSEWGWFDSDS